MRKRLLCLIAVLLVALGALVGWAAYVGRLGLLSLTIQPVTPQTLERVYRPIFIRCVQVVQDDGTISGKDLDQDARLVDAPEILEASVKKEGCGRTALGAKRLRWIARDSFFPRRVALERPVVNVYRCVLQDGTRTDVMSYEGLVVGPDGRKWEIRIDFDPNRLQRRLHASEN